MSNDTYDAILTRPNAWAELAVEWSVHKDRFVVREKYSFTVQQLT